MIECYRKEKKKGWCDGVRQSKELIMLYVNDPLYLYVKNESKRYHSTMTSFMNFMLHQVIAYLDYDAIKNDAIPIQPNYLFKYNGQRTHSLYLKVDLNVYDYVSSLVDTGVGRESMSKCARLLIIKYIELKQEGNV